jgi:hypothetical protein
MADLIALTNAVPAGFWFAGITALPLAGVDLPVKIPCQYRFVRKESMLKKQ